MGTFRFSGQHLRYNSLSAGQQPPVLNISSTIFNNSNLIQVIRRGVSDTVTNAVVFNPLLPPFLQGFTTFEPGSTYEFVFNTLTAFPFDVQGFAPPTSGYDDYIFNRKGVISHGFSIYTHLSNNSFNLINARGYYQMHIIN